MDYTYNCVTHNLKCIIQYKKIFKYIGEPMPENYKNYIFYKMMDGYYAII